MMQNPSLNKTDLNKEKWRDATDEKDGRPHHQHKPVLHEGFKYFQELVQSTSPEDAIELMMNPNKDKLLTLVTE